MAASIIHGNGLRDRARSRGRVERAPRWRRQRGWSDWAQWLVAAAATGPGAGMAQVLITEAEARDEEVRC